MHVSLWVLIMGAGVAGLSLLLWGVTSLMAAMGVYTPTGPLGRRIKRLVTLTLALTLALYFIALFLDPPFGQREEPKRPARPELGWLEDGAADRAAGEAPTHSLSPYQTLPRYS